MKVEKHNFAHRPKCIQCDKESQFMGTYNKDGSPRFRKFCVNCHYKRCADKKGISASQWKNTFHSYKKYRKDYCENAKGDHAGWLLFKCTTKIVMPHLQLDTDHLDGNPDNNEESNMMTLCKCCHAIKTNLFMDYATKGRKKLKKEKSA
jgi:hypothetical protein